MDIHVNTDNIKILCVERILDNPNGFADAINDRTFLKEDEIWNLLYCLVEEDLPEAGEGVIQRILGEIRDDGTFKEIYDEAKDALDDMIQYNKGPMSYYGLSEKDFM